MILSLFNDVAIPKSKNITRITISVLCTTFMINALEAKLLFQILMKIVRTGYKTKLKLIGSSFFIFLMYEFNEKGYIMLFRLFEAYLFFQFIQLQF